jgi:transcriptional regulator with XRE-family HTH domain
MSTIGKNVKSFRQKKGWSQREVAEQLNISVPAFSKIENGITDINTKRLNQLAKLLEVSIPDLMAKEGEHPEAKHSMHVQQLKIKLSKKQDEVLDLQKKVIELFEEIREKQRIKV